jgi:uncharacterized protein (DUF1697 family)
MSTLIALLRGTNVGGHKQVAMSELRAVLEALGFAGVRSLLQSGNLIFQSDRSTGTALERVLEVETAKRLQVSVDYFVRSAREWKTIVSANPFPNEAQRDPSHLVAMVLKTAPQQENLKALRAAVKGPEIIRSLGKQLYIVYLAGMGRSKLTHSLIERNLGSWGTGRNWNTVLKLAALCE